MGKSQIKSQVQITNHWQKWFKWKPQIKNQITNNQIKSNQNQITRFPNQILVLQIKSFGFAHHRCAESLVHRHGAPVGWATMHLAPPIIGLHVR